MKKTIFTNIIKTVAFILVLATVFSFLNLYLAFVEPVNIASISGFEKEPENSHDVVLIGASEVYADYSAMQAYEEYGYTSYSFGVMGIPGSVYKSMFREVIAKQKPKVVVFEVNGFLQKDSYYDRALKCKGWTDCIKDPERKELAINEIYSEEDRKLVEGNSFLLNHGNWKLKGLCTKSLNARLCAARQNKSDFKGFATTSMQAEEEKVAKTKKVYFTEKSKEYFEDLLNFCDESGVEHIVFARFPHARETKNTKVLRKIEKMVKKHGYEFIDFEEKSDEIDVCDTKYFYDVEHLNLYGAQKFTTYLGKYLTEKFDVKGDHSSEITDSWNESLAEYKKFREHVIQETDAKTKVRYFEYNR